MRKSRVLLAAGAGVAAVTFQGVFLAGCGSTNGCVGRERDGAVVNPCEEPEAGTDAKSDADAHAPDAANDAKSDAATDAESDAADAASDAETDAPADAQSD